MQQKEKQIVVGIDVGGSTTKIVGFHNDGALIEPMLVRAADQLTSIYGAFGKFTAQNDIPLSAIQRVMMTGVGSSFVQAPIYGLPCHSMPEFSCIGRGGLFLSGLDEAIVVSMGTGTALVHAKSSGEIEYLGGTGVGGGTLLGLSKMLLGMENISHIVELAKEGDLHRVDLRIRDITSKNIGVSTELTAANFGKISDLASKADIALGILNMIFETIARVAIFAASSHRLTSIVLIGNLASVEPAAETFAKLGETFGVSFIIPERSQFGTVIGAALAPQ